MYPITLRPSVLRRHVLMFAGTVSFILPGSFQLSAQGGRSRVPTSSTKAAPASASPQTKGIFEPVSYPEDIEFTGVYFVTPDIGWVTGHQGTLLHTVDGGEHWDAQLGGKAGSNDRPLWSPRFIDETHGWVVQSTGMEAKLLRTTNGDRWGQVGGIDEHYSDIQFTSPNDGVYVVGVKIFRTVDGGKSWRQVVTCNAKVQVNGLTRQADCRLGSISFPSLKTGYAVGDIQGVNDMFAMLKTEDGGATWTTTLVPDAAGATNVFFIDDRTGFVRTNGFRMFVTTDGGATWEGTVGTPGRNLAFADPEVGWSFNDRGLLYTTNGGKRWDQGDTRLPESPAAFSLPRRDRAYVVGGHGMIFRYRVVPATYSSPKASSAPTMPAFSMALDTDVSKLTDQVSAFAQALNDSSTSGAAGGATASSAGSGPASGVVPAAADASPFMKQAFGKRLSSLQLVFEATTGLLPDFLQRYRSLNVLAQALRTANALPASADSLKAALRELRASTDRAGAHAAMDRVRSQLLAFRQVADTALLKQGGAPAPANP